MVSITKRFDKHKVSIMALLSLNYMNATSTMILNKKFRPLSRADSPKNMALINSCKPVQ